MGAVLRFALIAVVGAFFLSGAALDPEINLSPENSVTSDPWTIMLRRWQRCFRGDIPI